MARGSPARQIGHAQRDEADGLFHDCPCGNAVAGAEVGASAGSCPIMRFRRIRQQFQRFATVGAAV